MNEPDNYKEPEPDPNDLEEELEYWFKYDSETQNFIVLFLCNFERNAFKLHFSKKLLESFLDDAVTFYINSLQGQDSEDHEDRFRF